MKTYLSALCLALIAVFALSACGGGNDTNSSSSDDKKEADKPKTPAEERQAVANKMKEAFVALDADAIKPLFMEEEHADLEKHILKDIRNMKAEGFKVTAETPTVEEKDGKFFANFPQTVESKDGTKEEDKPRLQIIEKDGKYYLSFKR